MNRRSFLKSSLGVITGLLAVSSKSCDGWSGGGSYSPSISADLPEIEARLITKDGRIFRKFTNLNCKYKKGDDVIYDDLLLGIYEKDGWVQCWGPSIKNNELTYLTIAM